MKLDLRTIDVINLANAISAAQATVKGGKLAFGMGLAYNARQLTNVMVAFDDARKNLIQVYGKRDDKGELVQTNDGAEQRVEIANTVEFNLEMHDLLEQTWRLELKELTESVLPETIDPAIVAGLYPIIAETES